MEDSIPPMKRCHTCGEEYPLTPEYFHRCKTNKDGFQYDCKTCRQAREKQRVLDRKLERENSPIQAAEKHCTICKDKYPLTEEYFSKNYRTKDGWDYTCKICKKKQSHETYMRNQEDRKRRVREYAQKNREVKRAKDRAYHLAHAEAARVRAREYRRIHAEEHRQYNREYAKTHRPQRRVNERNRRARLNSRGTHTIQDVMMQYKRQRGHCYYCKRKIIWGKHHVDHIVPLIKGGSNRADNLVIACPTCNCRKREKFLHEWLEGGRLI